MRNAAKAVKAFRFCTPSLADMVPILKFCRNLALSAASILFCPSGLRRSRTCPSLLKIILLSGVQVLGLDLNCSESEGALAAARLPSIQNNSGLPQGPAGPCVLGLGCGKPAARGGERT